MKAQSHQIQVSAGKNPDIKNVKVVRVNAWLFVTVWSMERK